MKENEHYLPQHMYEQACKVWNGNDMIEEMKTSMGITPLVFEAYKVFLGLSILMIDWTLYVLTVPLQAHLNSIVAAAKEPLFAK